MCRTWYGFAVVHARAGADWQPEGFADLGARRPGLAIAWVEPDPHALGLGQGPLGLQGGACSRAFFAQCAGSLWDVPLRPQAVYQIACRAASAKKAAKSGPVTLQATGFSVPAQALVFQCHCCLR